MLDQAKAIARNSDFQVIVLRPSSTGDGKQYTYDGVNVEYFPFVSMPSSILNGLPNYVNGLLFVRKLKRIGVKLEDVAVVHAHTSTLACCATAVKKGILKLRVLFSIMIQTLMVYVMEDLLIRCGIIR